jgi:hypothetical protein
MELVGALTPTLIQNRQIKDYGAQLYPELVNSKLFSSSSMREF